MFSKLSLLVILFALLSPIVNAMDIIVLPDSTHSLVLESPMAANSTKPPGTDANWQNFNGQVLNDGKPQWFSIRLKLKLEEGENIYSPLAFAVKVYGVYDFYWDDALVASNRYRGKNANLSSRVFIPISGLTEGVHTIKMRIIPIGMQTGQSLGLEVYPAALESDFFGVHSSVISTFFVAITTFFTGCYLVVVYRTGAPTSGLLSAIIISFSIFLLILLDEGKNLFSYPYSLQPLIDAALPPLAIMVFVLLPWLVFTRLGFKAPLKWMITVPIIGALSFINVNTIDHDIRVFSLLSGVLFFIACFQWSRGSQAARLYAIGFALSLTALWLDPNKKHLFLIVVTLMLATELALDIRRRSAEALRQKLISERLRADLIKRNIKPHFLMNSLTALMEWVETDQHQAVEFIEDLADEFRMLDALSEKSVITIEEELRLCRTHLNLMARRLNSRFTLETSNIDEACRVPPGIFHTLIENTFSHNNLANAERVFKLERITSSTQTTYVFRAPTQQRNSENIDKTQTNHLGTGTGTRYILARLGEFCGQDYVFSETATQNYWQTTIQINQARL